MIVKTGCGTDGSFYSTSPYSGRNTSRVPLRLITCTLIIGTKHNVWDGGAWIRVLVCLIRVSAI